MTSHSFLGLSPPQSLAAVTTEDGEAVTIHLKRGGSNSPTPTHTVNERFWTHIQFLGNRVMVLVLPGQHIRIAPSPSLPHLHSNLLPSTANEDMRLHGA